MDAKSYGGIFFAMAIIKRYFVSGFVRQTSWLCKLFFKFPQETFLSLQSSISYHQCDLQIDSTILNLAFVRCVIQPHSHWTTAFGIFSELGNGDFCGMMPYGILCTGT